MTPRPIEQQRYACKGGGVIRVCAIDGNTIHYLYCPPQGGRPQRLKTTRDHFIGSTSGIVGTMSSVLTPVIPEG